MIDDISKWWLAYLLAIIWLSPFSHGYKDGYVEKAARSTVIVLLILLVISIAWIVGKFIVGAI